MKHIVFSLVLLFSSMCAFAEEQDESESILNFPYYEATIHDIHGKLQSNDVSCYNIVKSYIDRILKYDMALSSHLPFNAIQSINQRALDQAIRLDIYYKSHHALRGPLHCIPVLVKDNIATEYMPMTAGSFALLNNQPNYNAPVIKSIERAGGIILASTTMDELSIGHEAVSSMHGRTANAYEVEQSAGGSSGGSAVGVSLNFGVLALSTDRRGSARLPASRNGLYSIRPSQDLYSHQGVLSADPNQDVIVPMARTPRDLAIVLNVLAKKPQNHYTRTMNSGSLQGKRIGLLQSINGVDLYQHENVKSLKQYKNFIKRLKGLGARFILKVRLDGVATAEHEPHYVDVGAIDASLKRYPSVRRDFMDLCESGRTNRFFELTSCNDVLKTYNKDKAIEKPKLDINAKLVSKLMHEKQLDALLLPLGPADDAAEQRLVSSLGLPIVSVLTGFEREGMPVAMQLIARPNEERLLLSIAHDYHLHFTPRSVPTIYAAPTDRFKSLTEFNFFKSRLAQYVYENFLHEHANKELTAKNFSKLYRKFIRQKDHS